MVFCQIALLAHHAQQFIAKFGARISEGLPTMHERPQGGLPPFENAGLRKIIFVDSRSSCEDRLDRSGVFKRSYRLGIRRYWSRHDRRLWGLFGRLFLPSGLASQGRHHPGLKLMSWSKSGQKQVCGWK